MNKEIVKSFISDVPLEIYQIADGKIMTVGVKWGFCGYANDNYGRTTVLKILDLLENNEEYQKLLA